MYPKPQSPDVNLESTVFDTIIIVNVEFHQHSNLIYYILLWTLSRTVLLDFRMIGHKEKK